MRRITGLVFSILVLSTAAVAQTTFPGGFIKYDGMRFPGKVTRDDKGIPSIQALSRADLAFLNGYVHAEDRYFQMDFNRRQASGTLAELMGPGALSTDVQLRTLGLRRAAEASLPVYSAKARESLEAYAKGVNLYVSTHALPAEYQALEITRVHAWTALDSVAIAKLLAFGLSFDSSDVSNTVTLRTYQAAGQQLGFDGTKLFFEDLFRSQPFEGSSTVPDARSGKMSSSNQQMEWIEAARKAPDLIRPETLVLAAQWLEAMKDIPIVREMLDPDNRAGSNGWAVAGRHTATGNAMLANDPHLALGTPSTFYPIALKAGKMNVSGHGFPGVPFVVHGRNARISWGSMVNPMDVSDTFQEQVVPDATAPARLSTMYNGQREALFPIVQVFRTNTLGNGSMDDLTVVPAAGAIPAATLIVPRRNAPIISLDTTTGVALSLQYTGFEATRELDTFIGFNEARNLDDFRAALQFFDFGSQNWMYSDVEGNIAYFTSGEMPIREDLQAGTVVGLPPFFIRNGTGGNDWIRLLNPPPGQATHAEILPFSEMPQIVNPPAGWVINANNDPIGNTLDNDPLNERRPGGGIYYLNPGYSNFRASRITQMMRDRLRNGGKISRGDMKKMQADVVLFDAQYFVPHILTAFDNAKATGADPALRAFLTAPGVSTAVERLRKWNFSTPTGIFEGYDDTDINGSTATPTPVEIDNSVGATIYGMWRGQMLRNTIDAVLAAGPLPAPGGEQAVVALKNLFVNFPTRRGLGASGINFFNVPEVTPTATNAELRRDLIILKSLADGLARLASDEFKPAFNNSTDQADYRWGKLHRIVFAHALGSVFSVPPGRGAFPPPLEGLTGIPTDGGFGVVDASSHNPRASTLNGFMFGSGPARRFVTESTATGIVAETTTPGGVNQNPASPFYVNLLRLWLTNDTYDQPIQEGTTLPWVGN